MTVKIDGSEVRIEPATWADLPHLVSLLDRLFDLEQDFAPDATLQRRGLELLLQRTDQAVVLAAHRLETPAIGMISAQLVVSTAQGAYSAWIEDVVVDQRFRGSGIGRALVEAALEWARERGATRAQLLVDIDNSAAIGFYAKLGWQSTHLSARRLLLEKR